MSNIKLPYQLPDGGKSDIPPDSFTNIPVNGKSEHSKNKNHEARLQKFKNKQQETVQIIKENHDIEEFKPMSDNTALLLAKQMEGSVEETNKHTIIRDAITSKEQLAYNTQLRNMNEVYQMNKLDALADFWALVFPDNEATRKVLAMMRAHPNHHRTNMVPFQRRRETGLFDALKPDSGLLPHQSKFKNFIMGRA